MRARPFKHLYRLVKLHPLLIANILVALASKWLFIPQHDSCTQQLIRYYRLVSSFEKLSSETIEHARLESMKPLKRLPKVMNELMTKDASLDDKGCIIDALLCRLHLRLVWMLFLIQWIFQNDPHGITTCPKKSLRNERMNTFNNGCQAYMIDLKDNNHPWAGSKGILKFGVNCKCVQLDIHHSWC